MLLSVDAIYPSCLKCLKCPYLCAASPLLLKELPQMVTIHGDSHVNVTCSFIARPASNLTWYKLPGRQPIGPAFSVNTSHVISGKYVITEAVMTWAPPSEIVDKGQMEGQYMCEASNKAGHVNSEPMEIHIFRKQQLSVMFMNYHYIPEKRKFSGILCFRQQRSRRRTAVRRTISLLAR